MEIRFHTRLVMSIHIVFHVLKREESKHFYCQKRYKRGCFSIFDGPPDTELKRKIGLHQDTRICNAQILRVH